MASLAAVAVTVAVFACGSLPDITGGCGNTIVETGEDCDTFVDGTMFVDKLGAKATCRAPGSEGECRFDCAKPAGASEADAQPKCPIGFSCGTDFICRKPAGKYKALPAIPSLADSILVADFDGDNVGDILARSRVDLKVYYGDPSAKFGTSFTIPASDVRPVAGVLTDPTAANVAADIAYGISDLGGPITVWQGKSTQSLVATPYPSLTFPAAKNDLGFQPRILSIEVLPAVPGEEVVVFLPTFMIRITNIGVGGGTGEVDLFPITYEPRNIVGLERGQLNEDPVGSPCEEFVVGVAGAPAVRVYTPCSGSAVNGLAGQAPPGGHVSLPDVQLDAASIASGLRMLDLNGDGHLDLMIDAVDGSGHASAQLSFGRGDGTFTSDPAVGAAQDNKAKAPTSGLTFPLAVGQLTKDGLLDFVTPQAILLSEGGGDAGAVSFQVNAPRGVAWNEAHILDLNGDGLRDVIAGSASGSIDVYTNGAEGLFNHSTYAADGATANFVFGDFDGDHNVDSAFVGGTDTLLVMFGRQNAAPEAPVRLAQFDFIEQIAAGELETSVNGSLPDGVTDLGIVWRSVDASLQNISILQGSTDRAIQAPFPLSIPAKVLGGPRGPASGALGLAIGHFTSGSDGKVLEPFHSDIAAVGFGPTPDNPAEGTIHFWRVQMFGEAALGPDPNRGSNLPALVGDSTTVSADPGVETYNKAAANAGVPGAVNHDWTHVQLATVDLHGQDGVSIDDLIVLAPPSRTGEGTLYVERSTNGVFADVLLPINLGPDRPDKRGVWQLGSADLNDDHGNEVVVFIDGTDAKVQVYWNGLKGMFDNTPHVIELPVDTTCKVSKADCTRPIGFAAVRADADAPKELFILTAEHVFSAKNIRGTGDFKVTEVITLGPIGPTSIAGGDVNGDGIDDVIVTTARAFTVFTGECAGVGCETRVLR